MKLNNYIIGVIFILCGAVFGAVTTVPASQPATQPAPDTQAETQPASTKPTTQAATEPTTAPATRAATASATRPATRPKTKPAIVRFTPKPAPILPPSISPGIWTVREDGGRRTEIVTANGVVTMTSGIVGVFERRPDGLYIVGKSGWVEKWGIYENRYIIIERWNQGGNIPQRDPDTIGYAVRAK